MFVLSRCRYKYLKNGLKFSGCLSIITANGQGFVSGGKIELSLPGTAAD